MKGNSINKDRISQFPVFIPIVTLKNVSKLTIFHNLIQRPINIPSREDYGAVLKFKTYSSRGALIYTLSVKHIKSKFYFLLNSTSIQKYINKNHAILTMAIFQLTLFR